MPEIEKYGSGLWTDSRSRRGMHVSGRREMAEGLTAPSISRIGIFKAPHLPTCRVSATTNSGDFVCGTQCHSYCVEDFRSMTRTSSGSNSNGLGEWTYLDRIKDPNLIISMSYGGRRGTLELKSSEVGTICQEKGEKRKRPTSLRSRSRVTAKQY